MASILHYMCAHLKKLHQKQCCACKESLPRTVMFSFRGTPNCSKCCCGCTGSISFSSKQSPNFEHHSPAIQFARCLGNDNLDAALCGASTGKRDERFQPTMCVGDRHIALATDSQNGSKHSRCLCEERLLRPVHHLPWLRECVTTE